MELSFKNMPFEPAAGQVIYMESSYNKKMNSFIRNNYEWLQTTFIRRGMTFCYMPMLTEELIRYNAPYISKSDRKMHVDNVPSLADYAVGTDTIAPALFFALDIPVKDDEGNMVMQYVNIDTCWYISTKTTFLKLIDEIKSVANKQNRHYLEIERRKRQEEVAYFSDQQSSDSEDCGIRFRKTRVCHEYDADFNFNEESRRLVEEIRERINALQKMGTSTLFLHNLINEEAKLSRLRIIKDYRIFLVDYNNMEINMSLLPKAVYLLFLRHPEGIRFKELSDYYQELLDIYKTMKPYGLTDKNIKSIKDITDSTNNSINEKCARVREAFLKNFDERLADHYTINGERGEAKRISLDRNLVIWD